MTTDPFIDLLSKQSAARLRDMETSLVAAMDRMGFELEIVRGALAEKQSGRRLPSREEADPRPPVLSRPSKARGYKRQLIKQIMETDPHRVWMPVEIMRAMADAGVEMSREAIRVTMRRMIDEHELDRPPNGSGKGFVLASNRNGLHQASANGSPPEAEETREQGERQGTRFGSE
jgi:hypothetical protein